MSFLVRITWEVGGVVIQDETTVADLDSLDTLEKDFSVLGVPGTVRVQFDPPLTPREVPE